jgi:hypothetical protein
MQSVEKSFNFDSFTLDLRRGFPEIADQRPELLAHHCTEAG